MNTLLKYDILQSDLILTLNAQVIHKLDVLVAWNFLKLITDWHIDQSGKIFKIHWQSGLL